MKLSHATFILWHAAKVVFCIAGFRQFLVALCHVSRALLRLLCSEVRLEMFADLELPPSVLYDRKRPLGICMRRLPQSICCRIGDINLRAVSLCILTVSDSTLASHDIIPNSD